jgi:site-specific DNA recombinase
MNRAAPRSGDPVRCAIYTRKSSEEGLEQEFNSLQAQREACAAFITSQRQQGWCCLPQAYDDGGRSGGTLARPALQQLLAGIGDGKVDIVVVYKIDRLTRSLADFAKLVEIFDTKGVSFVSVTQQFNTTTSIGRLTLNMLLSFAQFEREVSGERTRDKIAASKKKGMWMGGMPPLGYTVENRKLVIVEPEAQTVRLIFRRYAELGSVRLLQQELAGRGITGKSWVSAAGRCWGGKPIGRGTLYPMLQNRLYRGDITHKDRSYPGEHQAIVEPALWDAVQARLAENRVVRGTGLRVKNPSLLTGLLFDSEGRPMTPTHAVKNGRRYRYYVSRRLITDTRTGAMSGLRVAAAEIEQIVGTRIRCLLSQPASLLEILTAAKAGESQLLASLIATAAQRASRWAQMSPLQQRVIVLALIRRVALHPDRVVIDLRPRRLLAFLEDRLSAANPDPIADEPTLPLMQPVQLRRAGKEVRMVIEHTDPLAPAKPDPTLIKAIVKAHRFNHMLRHGGSAILANWPGARNCTAPITARSCASPTSPPTSRPPSSRADTLPV